MLEKFLDISEELILAHLSVEIFFRKIFIKKVKIAKAAKDLRIERNVCRTEDVDWHDLQFY